MSGFDCVDVLKAQYRQANHERAKVMALMAEIGLCGGVGPAGDELRRRSEPDQFAANEVRAALVLTRRAAEAQFWVAHALVTRLPLKTVTVLPISRPGPGFDPDTVRIEPKEMDDATVPRREGSQRTSGSPRR